MQQKIRWGIMGLGKIAHTFAQDLALLPDAQLTAVASRESAKALDFAKKYGASYAYDRYEALAASSNVDIIYIATPHHLHYPNTLMCLQADKPVLCEKPFALQLSHAQEMIALAQQKRVFLMEALWTRFLPHYTQLRTWIQQETFGKLQSIHADFAFGAPFNPESRLYDTQLGGGALMDVGIYPLFLAYSLLGKPLSLSAHAHFGATGADESTYFLLNYGQGVFAQLACSIAQARSVEANLYFQQARVRLGSPFHTPMATIEIIRNFRQIEKYPLAAQGAGYHYEAAEAMRCLRTGAIESPIWTHQDTLGLMEMLDWVMREAGIRYE